MPVFLFTSSSMAEKIRSIGTAALLSCVILFLFGCETVTYTSTGATMTTAELGRTVVDLERKVEELTREVAELNRRVELLAGAADSGGDIDTPLVEEEIIADETAAGEPESGGGDVDTGDAGVGSELDIAEDAADGSAADESESPPAGETPDSTPAGDPQALYDEALRHIMHKNPEEALVLFSRFVNDYPDCDLTDNAYYWLGESYYSLGDYESAARHFRTVTDSFPDRDKAPDAQLKLGYCLIELGETDAAVDVLTDLINRYPESPVSDLAREKLLLL